MKKNRYDMIVVGGGASGFLAAISGARAGAAVAIFDHHAVSGKKILSTGNGKCNFTNQTQGSDCYRCDDPAFVLRILEQFSQEDTLRFFRELGVAAKERQGYCYPRSGEATAIRGALLSEADRLGILLCNGIGIRRIVRKETGFCLQTREGEFFTSTCVLATGGKAAPRTGSDGSGYIYARQLGHSVREPLPALVPLVSDEKWLGQTAGVRCDAAVKLTANGRTLAADRGELQMTGYGISGIPVFQVSRFASSALFEKQQVLAWIDFLPELSAEDAARFLSESLERFGGNKTWRQILSGLVNQKVAAMFVERMGLPHTPVSGQTPAAGQNEAKQLAEALKALPVSITGTRGFEQAQVTCGGIPVSEIHPQSMESRFVRGLYFAGEIVDVDAICGGYNLQWAWSSGYVAGTHAAKRTSG